MCNNTFHTVLITSQHPVFCQATSCKNTIRSRGWISRPLAWRQGIKESTSEAWASIKVLPFFAVYPHMWELMTNQPSLIMLPQLPVTTSKISTCYPAPDTGWRPPDGPPSLHGETLSWSSINPSDMKERLFPPMSCVTAASADPEDNDWLCCFQAPVSFISSFVSPCSSPLPQAQKGFISQYETFWSMSNPHSRSWAHSSDWKNEMVDSRRQEFPCDESWSYQGRWIASRVFLLSIRKLNHRELKLRS